MEDTGRIGFAKLSLSGVSVPNRKKRHFFKRRCWFEILGFRNFIFKLKNIIKLIIKFHIKIISDFRLVECQIFCSNYICKISGPLRSNSGPRQLQIPSFFRLSGPPVHRSNIYRDLDPLTVDLSKLAPILEVLTIYLMLEIASIIILIFKLKMSSKTRPKQQRTKIYQFILDVENLEPIDDATRICKRFK